MTDELRALLTAWLSDPDPAKRAHARNRLALAEGEPVEPPTFAQAALGFARAVAGHVAAGMPTLGTEATAARLAVCEGCPARSDGTCTVCRCNLAVKASWADQTCPHGQWPETPRV